MQCGLRITVCVLKNSFFMKDLFTSAVDSQIVAASSAQTPAFRACMSAKILAAQRPKV